MRTVDEFKAALQPYYHAKKRDLPWRLPESNGQFDPYKIFVSEMMLQQTQVTRVIPKYLAFIETFPTIESLAQANLGQVLTQWNGLGYNRRAKFLHQVAQSITKDYSGHFPETLNTLTKLPGVGHNTAAAILVYAYNQPFVFIETNIRTVFIHHFFKAQINVLDHDILPLVEQTLDEAHPRDFYWALMDYGTYLKQSVGNLNRVSKHYVKQSKFEGSKRQIRGRVIKLLIERPQSKTELIRHIPDERLDAIIEDMTREGMIKSHGAYLRLQ